MARTGHYKRLLCVLAQLLFKAALLGGKMIILSSGHTSSYLSDFEPRQTGSRTHALSH